MRDIKPYTHVNKDVASVKLIWGYPCRCNGTEHMSYHLFFKKSEDAEEFAQWFLDIDEKCTIEPVIR